jgi:predicted SprT family Zn-dependent metalloprotease
LKEKCIDLPPSLGHEEQQEMFREALQQNVDRWQSFHAQTSFEMLTQKVNLQKFLEMQRRMAEADEKGIPYKCKCEDGVYKVEIGG